MCNFGIDVNDKFEGHKIKSRMELLQGKNNAKNQDEVMNCGFIIKVSKEYLEDTKTLRYISNLMKNENIDISINIKEISIEFKIIYENHVHVDTISKLNSCVEANINSVTNALNVFEIHEYEVISLFYFGNVPLKIKDIIM